MKLKYVKAILIGAVGVITVGGMTYTAHSQRNLSENHVESQQLIAMAEADETGVERTAAMAESPPHMRSAEMETAILEQISISGNEKLLVAQGTPQTAESEEYIVKCIEPLATIEATVPIEPVIEDTVPSTVIIDETADSETAAVVSEEKESPPLVCLTENKAVDLYAGAIASLNEEAAKEEKAKENKISDEAAAKAAAESEETVADETTAEENTGEAEAEAEQEIVIATVDSYVNVRAAGNLEAEILGKLYNHSVGNLLEETEDGWYLIESGNVTGYVSGAYVLRGEEAAQLADEVGQHLAEVTADMLRIREEPSTESRILGFVPYGDVISVEEETEGWAKITAPQGEGYVSADYVNLYTQNGVAESKEEEAERLRQEEEARRIAEAAAQEQARQQATQQTAGQQAAAGSSNSNAASGNTNNTVNAAPSTSGLGSQIANYALQFVGNPYVYGGTSLTNGADCSGFVMSIYQNFGISLPRTSGEQGACGVDVGGIGNAQPGDLVWYSGHIAIYIGSGQIVHAASQASGIKVSNANYRAILSVRRIV